MGKEGTLISRMLDRSSRLVPAAKNLLSGALLVPQALGISGFVTGGILTAYYGYSRGSLPGYANPDLRSHVDSQIQTAIEDLKWKPPSKIKQYDNNTGYVDSVPLPAVQPSSSNAWDALQSAESALGRTIPNLAGDVEKVEKVLFNARYGHNFTPQIQQLTRVSAQVSGLRNTPDARSFVAYTNDRNGFRDLWLGSTLLGAAAFGGASYIRREIGSNRQRKGRR